MAGPEDGPGTEHGLPAGDVVPRGADVGPGGDRRADLDLDVGDDALGLAPRAAVPRVGVLHHHHRVRARRERRAGEDAHRLAGAHRRLRWRTGRDGADDRERHRSARHVGGADGEPVDGRVGERRDVLGRDHVDRRDASEGVGERDGDGPERPALGQHSPLARRRGGRGSQTALAHRAGRAIARSPGRRRRGRARTRPTRGGSRPWRRCRSGRGRRSSPACRGPPRAAPSRR